MERPPNHWSCLGISPRHFASQLGIASPQQNLQSVVTALLTSPPASSEAQRTILPVMSHMSRRGQDPNPMQT